MGAKSTKNQPKDCATTQSNRGSKISISSSTSVDRKFSNHSLSAELDGLSDKLRKAYANIKLPNISWMDVDNLLVETHYVQLKLNVNNKTIPVEDLFSATLENDSNDIQQPQVPNDNKIDTTPPKRILVEAPSGYGKTTLAHKIIYDWTVQREYTRCFKLVFLIKLRNLDQSVSKELENIAEISGYENKDTVDKIISTCGNDTLIILDGLDELAPGCRKDVFEILFKSQFKDVTVVGTCRKGSYKLTADEKKKSLSDTEFYDKKVVIAGLDWCNRQILLRKFVTSAQRDDLVERVEKVINPVAKLFECPFFVIMLVLVIEDNPNVAIETRTDLYQNFIDCIVQRRCKKIGRDLPKNFTLFNEDEMFRKYRELFFHLGKLAVELLKKKTLQFECSTEIEEVYEMGFLSIQDMTKNSGALFQSEGFHLTTLEFAAAFSLWVEYKGNNCLFKPETVDDVITLYVIDENSLVIPFLCGLLGDEMSKLINELCPYAAIFSTSSCTAWDIFTDGKHQVSLSNNITTFSPPVIEWYSVEALLKNVKERDSILFRKVTLKNIQSPDFTSVSKKVSVENLHISIDEDYDFDSHNNYNTEEIECDTLQLSYESSDSRAVETWLEIFNSIEATEKSLFVNQSVIPVIIDKICNNTLLNMPIHTLSYVLGNQQQTEEKFIIHLLKYNQLQELHLHVTHGSLPVENIVSEIAISNHLQKVHVSGRPTTFIDIYQLTNGGEKHYQTLCLHQVTVDCTQPLTSSKCIGVFENTMCSNNPNVFSRIIPEVLHCDYQYIVDAYHETLFGSGWDVMIELVLELPESSTWLELTPCLSTLQSNHSTKIGLHVSLYNDDDFNCESAVDECLKSVNFNEILLDYGLTWHKVKFSACLDRITRDKIKIQRLILLNCHILCENQSALDSVLECVINGSIDIFVISFSSSDEILHEVIINPALDYTKYNIEHNVLEDVCENLKDLTQECICVSLR